MCLSPKFRYIHYIIADKACESTWNKKNTEGAAPALSSSQNAKLLQVATIISCDTLNQHK